MFGAALRLGLTSFGGPTAHIGYFREAYVERRRWLDGDDFAGMSAMFALLPTIGRNRLGLGPTGYGLLFGALGAGAVAATFIVPRVRARVSLETVYRL